MTQIRLDGRDNGETLRTSADSVPLRSGDKQMDCLRNKKRAWHGIFRARLSLRLLALRLLDLRQLFVLDGEGVLWRGEGATLHISLVLAQGLADDLVQVAVLL